MSQNSYHHDLESLLNDIDKQIKLLKSDLISYQNKVIRLLLTQEETK